MYEQKKRLGGLFLLYLEMGERHDTNNKKKLYFKHICSHLIDNQRNDQNKQNKGFCTFSLNKKICIFFSSERGGKNIHIFFRKAERSNKKKPFTVKIYFN